MAKYVFDPKKNPPASGSRQDYVKPGVYKVKITKYSDSASAAGKDMHAFTFEVAAGDEKGKKVTDYFVMPKTRKDSTFPLQRLNALIIAVAQPKTNKAMSVDLAKLKGKTVSVEISDVRQEASKGADGKDYPARTVSKIAEYIDPRAKEDDEDEDDEDEDADEEEDEEEEEEEAPKSRKPAAKKVAAKAPAKSKARLKKAAPAKKSRRAADDNGDDEDDEDDDDFPFDDDDDEEDE